MGDWLAGLGGKVFKTLLGLLQLLLLLLLPLPLSLPLPLPMSSTDPFRPFTKLYHTSLVGALDDTENQETVSRIHFFP